MNAELMVKPSSLMASGLQVKEFGDVYLFQFTEQLQARLEDLLEKHNADKLTPDEAAEWVGISELSRIFTVINAQLAAKAKWCPIQLDDWFDNVPDSSVNIVTPQNS